MHGVHGHVLDGANVLDWVGVAMEVIRAVVPSAAFVHQPIITVNNKWEVVEFKHPQRPKIITT